MKDYDETIAFLGQWGLFQKIVFFLLCLSIVPNGISTFSVVFIAATPSHHCLVPDVNLTQDWYDAIIPIEIVNGKTQRRSCHRYRLDLVRNLSAQGLIPGRDVNITDLEVERCVDGYYYSRDTYQSTLVSEFDLVCNDQWKQPFTSTVYFLGVLVGSFFSGQLSDRFGRKPVLFATMAIQTVFNFIQIFSPSWEVFCVLFFLNGLGQISNYVAAFVLGTEILTGEVRIIFSSMGVCLGFTIGYMMLPLFAYFLRTWESLMLGVTLPGLINIPLWWFIPESPRWLLSNGRVAEAEAVLRKAAKLNKVPAPEVIFEDCSPSISGPKTENKKYHNILNLLRTSNIRNPAFILCLVWLTITVGYFGLSLNTSQLHADPYLSCFFSAAVEVPAYICSWLALRHLHRRWSVIFVLLLGGLSLYFIQLIPSNLMSVSVALEMLGKGALTAGTALLFVYAAEIFPTVLRNTAVGLCTMVSRVGSCTAPFLMNLGVYFQYLPYIILGTLSVVSAFTALFLPETYGRPLPQTMEEMLEADRIKCPCIGQKEAPDPTIVLESEL
ncbi:uncharacterized protein V6R79_013839 [Siganus canaliculatus]